MIVACGLETTWLQTSALISYGSHVRQRCQDSEDVPCSAMEIQNLTIALDMWTDESLESITVRDAIHRVHRHDVIFDGRDGTYTRQS